MIKQNRFLSLVIAAGLLTSGAEAQPLPKKVQQERIKFLEEQIIPENKELLDDLRELFEDLSSLNEQTISLLDTITEKNIKHSWKTVDEVRCAAHDAQSLLEGPKHAAARIQAFMRRSFGEMTDLEPLLAEILNEYRVFSSLDTSTPFDLHTTALGEGSYYVYQLATDSFQRTTGTGFREIFEQAIAHYETMSEAAQRHDIARLKKLLADYIEYSSNDKDLIQSEIIDKIDVANTSWAKKVIWKVAILAQKEAFFNNEFARNLLARIDRIANPQEPHLPDVLVSSIEIVVPDKTSKCRALQIVAEIKNIGDLTMDNSRVKIIFPNGKENAKPVPELTSGQTHSIRWKHRLCKAGSHVFRVVANYDHATWEAATENNETNRAIVLPRCK